MASRVASNNYIIRVGLYGFSHMITNVLIAGSALLSRL